MWVGRVDIEVSKDHVVAVPVLAPCDHLRELIGRFVGPTIVGIQELPKTPPLDMLVRPCYNYGYFRFGC